MISAEAPAPAATGYTQDPSPVLVAAFARVMHQLAGDIPLANAAISVEAVGFERTSAGWLGVLITPLSMNLVLLPARGTPWRPLALGAKRRVALPAGQFEFFGGHQDGIGEYLYCSLFSPMSDFADQAAAVATAQEVCRQLFDPATARQVAQMNPSGLEWHRPEPEAPAAEPAPGRRALLRGRLR